MRKKSDLPFQSSNFVCEPCGDGSYGGEPLLSVGLAARKALNVLKYNWGNFSAALGLRVTGMGSAAAAPELISCSRLISVTIRGSVLGIASLVGTH
jgi:hypothetical protein